MRIEAEAFADLISENDRLLQRILEAACEFAVRLLQSAYRRAQDYRPPADATSPVTFVCTLASGQSSGSGRRGASLAVRVAIGDTRGVRSHVQN